MLYRTIFYSFIVLALLGDARVFLFVANRYVFASRREENHPYERLIWAMPPLLVGLTALFWPLGIWIERMHTMTWLEELAAAWLLIAATIGTYWIVDRIGMMFIRQMAIDGVQTLESTIAPFDLEITRHEVFIDALTADLDGYKIAFLSDTHVIPSRRAYFREVVAQTRALEPDLILLGGDLVTWERHVNVMSDVLLDGLTARDGVYAVLGNHDYWSGAETIIAALRARGIETLTNRNVTIRDRMTLAGIDEVYRGHPDVEAALRGAKPVRIAFSHHPDIIDEIGEQQLDLLLCGHTHGGQIRLPLFGALFVPSVHEALYVSGFHRVRNTLMYVGRGIGGVPPIRVRCRAELPLFMLRATHR